MYPNLTQALAAQRVRDQQQQAALARLARKARRARRGRPDGAANCLAADCLAADRLAVEHAAADRLGEQGLVHADHDGRELAGVR